MTILEKAKEAGAIIKDAKKFDLDTFDRFDKLNIPREQVDQRIREGEVLKLVESSFSEPGPDYNKLVLRDPDTGREQLVAYWEGY